MNPTPPSRGHWIRYKCKHGRKQWAVILDDDFQKLKLGYIKIPVIWPDRSFPIEAHVLSSAIFDGWVSKITYDHPGHILLPSDLKFFWENYQTCIKIS